MKTIRNLATATALILGAATMAPAQTLNFAYDADPVSLDPHEQLSGGTLQLSHMIFDPLVRWNSELGFDARLAESWERIDDTTMQFHLRGGVTFHSGNPMTADDVVWTINRLKESPDFKGIFAGWVSATAVDGDTVEIKTDGPSPLVLHTATYVFPMDSAFYEAGGAEIVKHGDSFASAAMCRAPGLSWSPTREQGVKVTCSTVSPNYWDTASLGNVRQPIVLTPIKEAPDPRLRRCSRVTSISSRRSPPTDLKRIDSGSTRTT